MLTQRSSYQEWFNIRYANIIANMTVSMMNRSSDNTEKVFLRFKIMQ